MDKGAHYKIDLKKKDVKDSDNVFDELATVRGIKGLDLSDNLLTRLPTIMSMFESLLSLDITNNPFKNVRIELKFYIIYYF